jgi:hypothetical protein
MPAQSLLWRIVGASLLAVTLTACSGGDSKQTGPSARPAAFRDAAIYDADISDVPYVVQLPDCPASCDDQNPCTKDSCDPETHLCLNDPATEGAACVGADLCSLEASCKSGLCVGTKTKNCTVAPDQCHEEGYCIPTTGLCMYPNSKEHKGCDDGDLCTTGDQCISGACQAAPIQCGAGVTCDQKTGQCPGFPSPIWGYSLDTESATAAAYPAFNDLTVSPSGSVYFTATFANTLDLGAGSMSTTTSVKTASSNFDYNVVIARLDPATGKALWSRSMGDKASQAGSSIAVNASETVLVSGFYNGKIDFGPAQGLDAGVFSFTNTSSFGKVFLVAIDGISAAVAWALPIELSTVSGVTSLHTKVAADLHDGNFVLCATPSKMVTDLGSTYAGGMGDVLIAKLQAATGRVLWVRQLGSAADESCDAITVDSSGRIYITGHLTQGSILDIGSGIVLSGPTGKSQQAAYVAQFDGASGKELWATAFYSREKATGKLSPSALATDGKSLWLGGSFTYSALFGVTLLPNNATGLDAGTSLSVTGTAFVAALDAASGKTVLWAKNWGTNAHVYAIALTSSGNLILGGDYQSGMEFETGRFADAGAPVPFVAKLASQTGQAFAARGYASSSTSSSAFQTMVVDSAGQGSERDVAYGVGSVGDLRAGVDLGQPVGQLRLESSALDGGAEGPVSTLFLAKFRP